MSPLIGTPSPSSGARESFPGKEPMMFRPGGGASPEKSRRNHVCKGTSLCDPRLGITGAPADWKSRSAESQMKGIRIIPTKKGKAKSGMQVFNSELFIQRALPSLMRLTRGRGASGTPLRWVSPGTRV